MRILRWCLLCAVFMLCGCAAGINVSRPSPKVDVTVDRKEVTKALEKVAEEQKKGAGGREAENAASQAASCNRPLSQDEWIQSRLDSALELCSTARTLWAEGHVSQALAALDKAYLLIMQVDKDAAPQFLQQKEDIRFIIAKNILEIRTSRFRTTNGLHKEIPITLNRHVMEEIARFQGRERQFFLDSYKRSGRYRPMIVKALKEAGLPEELSWLPLIESGFKIRALSRARALGLWQFIPSTGYKFGLNRNVWIDERLDPEKSTKAAIAYMIELHKIFGDWMTVLAAYNCGEGNVLKAIRAQQVDYIDHFWDLYERLPRETARYVPRFLAVLQILKEPAKYGFDLPDPDPPLEWDTVPVKKQLHLRTVAKAIGVDYQFLRELNPELRHNVTPGEAYSLRVPKGKGEVLAAKLDSLKEWLPPAKAYVWHRVRRGETLSLIAQRYNTTVWDIVRVNRLRHKHLIRAGQKLKIPLSTRKKGKIVTVCNRPPEKGEYVVKPGDSLWIIAKKFGISAKKLAEMNNLKSNRIYVGQILRVK